MTLTVELGPVVTASPPPRLIVLKAPTVAPLFWNHIGVAELAPAGPSVPVAPTGPVTPVTPAIPPGEIYPVAMVEPTGRLTPEYPRLTNPKVGTPAVAIE